MAKPEGITFRGNNYLPDWGSPNTPIKYSYTFKIPDGLSTANIDAIIDTVGGEPAGAKGIPCDDEEGYAWTPRKLKFWFSSGKTVSVPAPNKTQLVTQATAIALLLSSIQLVVCVSLEGETWRNIIDLLDPTTSLLPPTPLPIADTPPGQKEPSYVGSMNYETDGSREFSKAFKMATNLPGNVPYAEYATAINNCLLSGGPLNTSQARCPGFRQLTFDHRRFRVVMLQNRRVVSTNSANEVVSSTTSAKSELLVPMSSRVPADIRTCALALRAVPHTMCLGYRGEWDKRFASKNPGVLP
jgi:hypothetical protein